MVGDFCGLGWCLGNRRMFTAKVEMRDE